MTLVGVGVTNGIDLASISPDKSYEDGDISFATESSRYKASGSTKLYYDTTCYAFTAPDKTAKNYVFAVFQARGRDDTIAPDITSAPSGWVMGNASKTQKVFYYEFTTASAADPVSTTGVSGAGAEAAFFLGRAARGIETSMAMEW